MRYKFSFISLPQKLMKNEIFIFHYERKRWRFKFSCFTVMKESDEESFFFYYHKKLIRNEISSFLSNESDEEWIFFCFTTTQYRWSIKKKKRKITTNKTGKNSNFLVSFRTKVIKSQFFFISLPQKMMRNDFFIFLYERKQWRLKFSCFISDKNDEKSFLFFFPLPQKLGNEIFSFLYEWKRWGMIVVVILLRHNTDAVSNCLLFDFHKTDESQIKVWNFLVSLRTKTMRI